MHVGADWFCEAVWDAPFAAGDFDRTDLVFGSGARVRRDTVTFVTSGSTVERLHSIETGEWTFVSNSFPCLLAATGGSLDPTYAAYFTDFKSISRGLARYVRTLVTSAGPVRLTYFNNLAWDGSRLREVPKPTADVAFPTFQRYRDFLSRTLALLSENMGAPERTRPLRWLGTISSGYDSATAATLARPHGLVEAISFGRASSGDRDSGEVIADTLGIRLSILSRESWRAGTLSEVPFVAADAKGEDVYFRAAEADLAGRVLLTGFHGDRIWDRRPHPAAADLARGDQSGLSLSEYRLWAGFLHCPLPFAGVRRAAEITAISRSPEMARWHTGGRYSRPICQRVLEEAGIPRRAFGQWKKTASVLFFTNDQLLSPASQADYRAWLEAHLADWRERGMTPPDPAVTSAGLWYAPSRAAAQFLERLAHVAPRRLWWLRSGAQRLLNFAGRERLFRYLFPWAMEHATRRYAGAVPAVRLDPPVPALAHAHGHTRTHRSA
ncbi:MAG TPA: hypothetical protein VNH63_07000 [Gemmatimonadales bacterium]|nr:hypothetical protein [Gemmatimonadales bacterium]